MAFVLHARLALTSPLVLLACERGDERNLPTPEIVAVSKYVEYSTWGDASSLCMDGRLAEADRFIVETATFLHANPPPLRSIRYIHVPRSLQDPGRTWACSTSSGGCFLAEGKILDDRSVIYGDDIAFWHELVHAVDFYAIGLEHWVLQEGLADYVSKGYSTGAILDSFPEMLKADLEVSDPSSDYRAATHFVGSLIQRFGIVRFKKFGARMDRDARLQDFATAYAQEFGEDFDLALAGMALTPITTRRPLDCTGEVLPWPDPGEFHAKVVGACGDDHYYSPGSAPETPGAFRQYVIDVAEAAAYRFSIDSTVPGTKEVTVISCDVERRFLWTAVEGEGGTIPLDVGRHVLSVGFPDGGGSLGDVDIWLTQLESF